MEPIPLASRTNYLSWYEANPNRFMAERAAVQQAFADRFRWSKDQNGALCLRGIVKQSGKELPVRIVFPETYPNTPPVAYIERDMQPNPHLLPGGKICWINDYSSECKWNPGKHNVTLTINGIRGWYASSLVFYALGEWPKGTDD